MTLASRPVFGAQCLSNMLSGNLSNPNAGTCSAGASPAQWGDPIGSVIGLGTLDAWIAAGYVYGVFDGTGATKKVANYTGGTLMSDFTTATGILAPTGSNPLTLTVRDCVRDATNAPIARHLTVAYLNAKLSENSPGFQYILTPQQVIGLGSGAIPVPSGYASLRSFLDSTWT
jgi:hypothetical protein